MPLGPGDDDPRSPVAVVVAADASAPLGPGDADPRSPAAISDPPSGPLGPGDDDPKSPAKGVALPATSPLGPGESTEPHDGRIMLAPAPAGPGGIDTGPRHVTHVTPKSSAVTSALATVQESEE